VLIFFEITHEVFAIVCVRANAGEYSFSGLIDLPHNGNLDTRLISIALVYAESIYPDMLVGTIPVGLSQHVFAVMSDNDLLAV
jgi:hypothetical protein